MLVDIGASKSRYGKCLKHTFALHNTLMKNYGYGLDTKCNHFPSLQFSICAHKLHSGGWNSIALIPAAILKLNLLDGYRLGSPCMRRNIWVLWSGKWDENNSDVYVICIMRWKWYTPYWDPSDIPDLASASYLQAGHVHCIWENGSPDAKAWHSLAVYTSCTYKGTNRSTFACGNCVLRYSKKSLILLRMRSRKPQSSNGFVGKSCLALAAWCIMCWKSVLIRYYNYR